MYVNVERANIEKDLIPATIGSKSSSLPSTFRFCGMKNELLCGEVTVVDCIYGVKLNLMLLAISSQYFFPYPSLAASLDASSLFSSSPGASFSPIFFRRRTRKSSAELNLWFKFACFLFSSSSSYRAL